MDFEQVIQQLESVGTAQNRKIYARHGIGENQYGVSYADLGKLQKALKKNHPLALQLWHTGNHDARILACKIADPQHADDTLLNSWVQELDNYVITDAFSEYAAKTQPAAQKIPQWTADEGEWVGTAGWNMLGTFALAQKELPADFFSPYLATIQRDIHTRKNRVRYAMNNALICIGCRGGELLESALQIAAQIGKVEVDHGETNCATPDAATYIQKTLARKKN